MDNSFTQGDEDDGDEDIDDQDAPITSQNPAM